MGIGQETIDLLEKEKFFSPTPVQEKTIPFSLEGKDLLVSAKTGSGKTAGFCLPLIEKLRGRKGTLGVIVCPVREIALQTHEVVQTFALPQGLQSVATIGGVNIRQEEQALREYPQIIVGTPGRIADHIERGNLWLDYVEMVILDEADRMLDMGFSKQLNQIMDATSKDRQTLFFSATVSGEAEKLANRYLKDPIRISLGSALSVADTITQELLWLNDCHKKRELLRLIEEETGSIIVFTSTKVDAQSLWRSLYSRGHHDASYLSSDKIQKHREQVLDEFKEGKTRILVATDVAGRGIHVDHIAHVINFDFPLGVEDYIHRVGRTGRNGQTGKATSFITPEESKQLIELEKYLGSPIPEKKVFDFELDPRIFTKAYQRKRKPYRNHSRKKSRNSRSIDKS